MEHMPGQKNAFSTATLAAVVSTRPCLEGGAHILRADEGLELLGVDLLLDLGEQHACLLNVCLAFALLLEEGTRTPEWPQKLTTVCYRTSVLETLP